MTKKKAQTTRGPAPQEPPPPMWAAVQELADQVRQHAEKIQRLEEEVGLLRSTIAARADDLQELQQRLRSVEHRSSPESWPGP